MVAILMPTMAELKRVQFGARLEAQYKQRIKAVAKKKKTSPRSILEQILDKVLPELEKEAGILHESSPPSDSNPKGGKAK